MHLLSAAKINLHLRVGPRDAATGFHPLMSWVVTVGLFDRLILRRIEQPLIRLRCDNPDLAADSSNLVVRAAQAMQNELSGTSAGSESPCPGVEIELHKHIPISAGLGGGSADAARTLLGLNRLWDMNLSLAQLHEIAATLGSDVPFFLHGPSSICTGRGEIVRPIVRPRVRWALLILPDFALPTAKVYAKFDELRLAQAGFSHEPLWQQWTDLAAQPLLERLENDLEPAAFALAPQLGELRRLLERSLSRVIRMTGSGSTLFTLFDEREQAERAAQVVQAQHSLRAVVAELAPRIEDDLQAA